MKNHRFLVRDQILVEAEGAVMAMAFHVPQSMYAFLMKRKSLTNGAAGGSI
jgi:hypothetical protein